MIFFSSRREMKNFDAVSPAHHEYGTLILLLIHHRLNAFELIGHDDCLLLFPLPLEGGGLGVGVVT